MQSKFDDNNFSYEADLIQNNERQLQNRNKELSKCDDEFSEIKERTEIVQTFYYSPKERKASNDTLSINGSQAETLSQTSESSFFLSFTNSNKSQLNSSKENIQVENKQNVDVPYYFGLEEYYQKIMPEKFTEYKKTKNYLPKFSKAIKNEESFNTLEQNKSKEMSQNSMQFQCRNYFPFPYYGLFYQVNPLMFNHFSKTFINNQYCKGKNKNKKIIKKNSDEVKQIKEDKIEDKKENKTNDKKEDKKDNKNEEKIEQIEAKVQKQQKQYSKNTNKAQYTSNKNNYKRNTDKEYNNQRNSNYNNYNGQYKKNYKKNYNYKYNHYNYYDYNDNYQNERSFYNNNYHKRRNYNMYENEF
jgi:hypothetical protein